MPDPQTMRAWRTRGDGHENLRLADVRIPTARDDELLVRVLTSGFCRTDLHVADGDLPPHRSPVVPGHEIVGTVEAVGRAVEGSVDSFARGLRRG